MTIFRRNNLNIGIGLGIFAALRLWCPIWHRSIGFATQNSDNCPHWSLRQYAHHATVSSESGGRLDSGRRPCDSRVGSIMDF
jgi:hypothetical protein